MKIKQLLQTCQNLVSTVPQRSQPGTAQALVVRTGVRAGLQPGALLGNFEASVLELAEIIQAQQDLGGVTN